MIPLMDPFFCLKGGHMSQLQSLEQIENINNLSHRAVLKALRDTTYSIAEIAARLGIHRSIPCAAASVGAPRAMKKMPPCNHAFNLLQKS